MKGEIALFFLTAFQHLSLRSVSPFSWTHSVSRIREHRHRRADTHRLNSESAPKLTGSHKTMGATAEGGESHMRRRSRRMPTSLFQRNESHADDPASACTAERLFSVKDSAEHAAPDGWQLLLISQPVVVFGLLTKCLFCAVSCLKDCPRTLLKKMFCRERNFSQPCLKYFEVNQ